MNTLYEIPAKIIIILVLCMYFFPEHLPHFVVAILALYLFDFANHNSGKYKLLGLFQVAKEKYRRYLTRRNLRRSIEKNKLDEYQEELITNALDQVKSSNESDRKIGLEQLSQFGTEDAYEKLLEILKTNVLDKSYEKRVIKTLCDMKNMNEQ